MKKTLMETATSRRALLAATAAILPLAAMPASLRAAPAAAAVDDASFLKLSAFVTGKQDLNPLLATRFLAAIQRFNEGFGPAATALQAFIDETKAGDIDALMAQPGMDAGVKKTIETIVSAWYLGIVGNDTGAELVTYAEALMYRPTRKELVIPTYGAGPDTWGPNPDNAGAAL